MAEPSMLACSDANLQGTIGIRHLERLRSRLTARPRSLAANDLDIHLDMRLLDTLGLGLEQGLGYLAAAKPDLEQLEAWVLATAGLPDPLRVARFNAVAEGAPYPNAVRRWLASIDAMEDVLSPTDMEFWRVNGFVVLHDAVDLRDRDEAVEMIWRAVGGDPKKPETWYQNKTRHTMLQVFQDPALSAIRRSARVHRAFAQIWGTADLCMSTDRCGFSAPVREGVRNLSHQRCIGTLTFAIPSDCKLREFSI